MLKKSGVMIFACKNMNIRDKSRQKKIFLIESDHANLPIGDDDILDPWGIPGQPAIRDLD